MMKKEDALGLMEDLSVMHANFGATDAQRRGAHNEFSRRTVGAVVGAGLAMKDQRQQISQLKDELSKVANARNAHAAVSAATNAVLQNLIKAEADRTGETEAAVRSRLNYDRSRAYDRQVAQYMADGYLSADPRLDPEMKKQTPWYIPEFE